MRSNLLFSLVLAASSSVAFCASGDYVGTSSSLSLDHATHVPGDTLKPGTYSISVVEQLADRMVVRIDSTTSSNHIVFLGVPSTPGQIGGDSGPVAWGTGLNKTSTLRGFTFPDGKAVEFVYPKADAAALAKENSAKVVAVDPRSEGRVSIKNLSPDELDVVNLWLLSLTTAGPSNKTPAILAQHYPVAGSFAQMNAAVAPAPAPRPVQREQAAPVQRAAVAPVAPAVPVQPAAVARTPRTPARNVQRVQPAPHVQPAPVETATLEQPANPVVAHRGRVTGAEIATLPHTASSLPMVWMVGLFSLLGTLVLRMWRGRTERRAEG